ncbi:MAG: hypothetical protein D4R63_00645 [Methylococcaceae bacterium]|nr:MAG: hypothetical protein D4R63_00645 [Methylococcaceae bacterium]
MSPTARNPKTDESMPLPASVAIHFKPGKELKSRVNASRGHELLLADFTLRSEA